MKGSVLVLNASYEYLNVTSLRRAILMIVKRKAEIVEAVQGRFVSGERKKFGLPTVVRMLYYIKRPFKEIPVTRKNIVLRDRNICQYCSGHGDTVDHVYPRSRGGKDTWENCVCACGPCNRRKNNLTPDEAGMTLLSKPKKPALVPWLMLKKEPNRQSWARYLFWDESMKP